MADTLQLEIVTPDKLVVKDTADEVQIPGKAGYMDVLPGHAPLITELMIGEITYKHGGTAHHFSVAWGFAEVLPDKVTILAQTAERAEDIDVKRAQEAKARAEAALARAEADLDYEVTLNAIKRAEVRLAVAQYANSTAHDTLAFGRLNCAPDELRRVLFISSSGAPQVPVPFLGANLGVRNRNNPCRSV